MVLADHREFLSSASLPLMLRPMDQCLALLGKFKNYAYFGQHGVGGSGGDLLR